MPKDGDLFLEQIRRALAWEEWIELLKGTNLQGREYSRELVARLKMSEGSPKKSLLVDNNLAEG